MFYQVNILDVSEPYCYTLGCDTGYHVHLERVVTGIIRLEYGKRIFVSMSS